MLPLARTNPAVVSWTLNELFDNDHATAASEPVGTSQSPRSAMTGTPQPSDPAIAEGQRLREALQALLDGFGACGSQLSRHWDGRLVQWGVQLLGDDWIALSEARDTLPPPDLVTVAGNPWDRPAPEWTRRTKFHIPRGPLGRWSWARNQLMQRLAQLIQERRLPLPPDSPLASERQWILARRIMQIAGKPHGTVILLADLRRAVDGMMERVDRSVHATWSGGGMRIDSHDIRWIHARLQREAGDQLTQRWPAPDQPHVWARWRWQGYSPELSRAITTEVLGAAITGYRDLVAENFAAFGWALGLNSALPVQVEGTPVIPDDDTNGEYTSLQYQLKPIRPADREAVSHVHLDLVTQPGSGRRAGAGRGHGGRDCLADRCAFGEHRLGNQPRCLGASAGYGWYRGLSAFCAWAVSKVRLACRMNAKRGVPSSCASSGSATVATPTAIFSDDRVAFDLVAGLRALCESTSWSGIARVPLGGPRMMRSRE
jgi:hypothetical protein